jgi:hypothetical protein
MEENLGTNKPKKNTQKTTIGMVPLFIKNWQQ